MNELHYSTHPQTGKIESISDEGKHYDIKLTTGECFYLQKKLIPKRKTPIVPAAGDTLTLHTYGGSSIRGIDLNGSKLYYKTVEQLEAEHQKWSANYKKQKEKAFKKGQKKLDKAYDKLPEVFKKRIDRFRANNPNFRVDFESYEMFCCEQAVIIANALKTPEAIEDFRTKKTEEQMALVPKLSDGHSGNTFGCAVALAYWYLKEAPLVQRMHGALSPLVGSKEYGDIPKKD